ncbi:sialyltransferase-like protein 2 isoform X2 [Amborella trichopoda]|uniref:sialyltransferase-like protein 2 isoform X2 n=1 Tax=Amborella trichopoda TaxID=13333 RepID=UPI0009BF548A|nr:sialyltransferase-like protein 2 isoform X2 [Amborella trichopoda]|eukprot:XP_020522629.1 sialyltransferase-like protein 2 isoform X2 [Amborella trichopoda]
MKVLQLGLAVAVTAGIAATIIYIVGVSTIGQKYVLSDEDVKSLESLQTSFKKCVRANGLGLQAFSKDHCQITLGFPSDTVPKWEDPKTGELEGLSFDFNLCEALATWEQVRNSTTILTKEFIDALPNGWQEYAWRRINKGIQLNQCQNKTLCMEKLALVLPNTPPFVPRRFGRCAVIGNSGDLLKTRFGKEIDGYDAVVRENGAPIQNYTEYVGTKSTFRLLNRGSAKALDKVAELDVTGKEVLIIKTTIHDIMSKMIREKHFPSGCYLFRTRYFSESRQGHTPLHGRAYYQMMECLGLIKIHSPMRAEFNRNLEGLPSKSTLYAARIAFEKVLGRAGASMEDPLAACSIVKRCSEDESMRLSILRKAALDHHQYVKGATMYTLEHRVGNGMVCILPKA